MAPLQTILAIVILPLALVGAAAPKPKTTPKKTTTKITTKVITRVTTTTPVLTTTTSPLVTVWGQCGGSGWTGPTKCADFEYTSDVSCYKIGTAGTSICVPIIAIPTSALATTTTTPAPATTTSEPLAQVWGLCGGGGTAWSSPTKCSTILHSGDVSCVSLNPTSSICFPTSDIVTSATIVPSTTTNSGTVITVPSTRVILSLPTTTTTSLLPRTGMTGLFGQCGGIGWTGATICSQPYTCSTANAYFAQCL